jgi:hypothetical protein
MAAEKNLHKAWFGGYITLAILAPVAVKRVALQFILPLWLLQFFFTVQFAF